MNKTTARLRFLFSGLGGNSRALAVLVLAMLSGCGGVQGPERVAVNGVVTVNGAPLREGVIRFIPNGTTQGPAAAGRIVNGEYELLQQEGPIVGTHRVEIAATDYYGFAIDDEAAYVAHVERKGRGKGGLPKNPIPEKYNRKSELRVEVSPEDHAIFDFSLDAPQQHYAGR